MTGIIKDFILLIWGSFPSDAAEGLPAALISEKQTEADPYLNSARQKRFMCMKSLTDFVQRSGFTLSWG